MLPPLKFIATPLPPLVLGEENVIISFGAPHLKNASAIAELSSFIYLVNSVLLLRQISKGTWKLEKRLLLLLGHGSGNTHSRSAFYTSTKTSYKKAFKTAAPLPAGKRTKLLYFKADTTVA